MKRQQYSVDVGLNNVQHDKLSDLRDITGKSYQKIIRDLIDEAHKEYANETNFRKPSR